MKPYYGFLAMLLFAGAIAGSSGARCPLPPAPFNLEGATMSADFAEREHNCHHMLDMIDSAPVRDAREVPCCPEHSVYITRLLHNGHICYPIHPIRVAVCDVVSCQNVINPQPGYCYQCRQDNYYTHTAIIWCPRPGYCAIVTVNTPQVCNCYWSDVFGRSGKYMGGCA